MILLVRIALLGVDYPNKPNQSRAGQEFLFYYREWLSTREEEWKQKCLDLKNVRNGDSDPYCIPYSEETLDELFQ